MKPLTPGQAFLLAYLPARSIACAMRRAWLENAPPTDDPALQHAVGFMSMGLRVEATADEDAARHAALAAEVGIAISPTGEALHAHLSQPTLAAAWRAGESARAVAIAAMLAAHVVYFRDSAPNVPRLRTEAVARARELQEAAAKLAEDLRAIDLPPAQARADIAARMIATVEDLSVASYVELSPLSTDLCGFLEATGRALDATPIAPVTLHLGDLFLRREEGWSDLETRLFCPARPLLQPVLERALGLLRADALRALSGKKNETAAALSFDELARRRRALHEAVRARTMAAEDAWDRLAPKTWLDWDKRLFVCEKIPPDAVTEEPTLSVAWTSWVLRRTPTSIDYVTSLAADPEHIDLVERHAMEACRRMSQWGFRTPSRFVWLAEEAVRFHPYEGARPFRERADEMLGFELVKRPIDDVQPHHGRGPTEAEIVAKMDLLRSNEWKARGAATGPNPFESIVEIWRLGYALVAVVDVGVVLAASAPSFAALLEPLVA